METATDIRPASGGDASAMLQVKQITWPEEEVRLSQVENVLADAAHEVYVADVQGQVIGFADSFATRAPTRELRWEIDLLAVHPDWRGRQVGQALIMACLKAGKKRRAAFARALIQVENRASQISFERSGFKCQPELLELFTAPPEEGLFSPETAGGHLLLVNTINYFGLWLEEDHRESSLRAARAASWQHNCDFVGTLVNQADMTDNEKMSDLGFTKIGNYQWWILPFEAT
jgi:GNAT superfamily N-acetyltransferase